jgi:hypothetical protein
MLPVGFEDKRYHLTIAFMIKLEHVF